MDGGSPVASSEKSGKGYPRDEEGAPGAAAAFEVFRVASTFAAAVLSSSAPLEG